jgi:hypothetical protein
VRNLIILVLGAAVVWLLMERSRLADEVAAAKSDIAAVEKRAELAEKQLMALNPGGRGARKESWLDPHIEKGAKALNTEQVQKGLR